MTPDRESNRINELEIEEDYAFQRRSWTVQRWARIGVHLFIVAGLIGLFGDAGLAMRTVKDPTGKARLEYSRIARFGSSYEMKLSVDGSLVENNELVIAIDQSVLEMLHLEGVTPESESQEVQAEQVVYRFRVTGEARRADVDFRFKPTSRGYGQGQIRVGHAEAFRVEHFILP